ncbi:MAG: hypothetical protein IEMM0002_0672 [bacterium]|nr:MAG: hypothetical protein IEMM0002_0672 [bacterium]
MSIMEKISARKAHRIFTPSEYAKKKLCAIYRIPEKKVEVMKNGLFFNEWVGRIDAAPRPPRRPLTALSVAMLYKRKGVDLLLKAWKEVLCQCPDAILRIVGDGLEKNRLKKISNKLRLGKSVVWEGAVLDQNILARHFANCDVFCLPSLHETFGLVFIEAMAAQKPVVAFNATAVPEVVRNGRDGFLLEPGDYHGVAEKIVFLFNNPDLRMKMGMEGRQRVKRDFDITEVVSPLTDWMECDAE